VATVSVRPTDSNIVFRRVRVRLCRPTAVTIERGTVNSARENDPSKKKKKKKVRVDSAPKKYACTKTDSARKNKYVFKPSVPYDAAYLCATKCSNENGEKSYLGRQSSITPYHILSAMPNIVDLLIGNVR
jgi:hypothetical protein